MPTLDLSETQPWWRIRQFRETDEQHIERVRRTVTWWIRWRLWMLAFFVALTAGLLGTVFVAESMFKPFAPDGNDIFGFMLWLSIAFGFKFGLAFNGAIWGIFQSLSTLRTEQLLLQYVDQPREDEASV